MKMGKWTSEELKKIEKTDELEIAALQKNGKLRKPTTIWVVQVGEDLYIRAVNGRKGAWYLSTQERHEGHIKCDGVKKDVRFEDAGPEINDKVDEAYRQKYKEYEKDIVDTEFTEKARATTQRLVPK